MVGVIVMDNCEDILNNNADRFHEIVSQLLEHAHGCSVLLASRVALGGGISGVPEKVLHSIPLGVPRSHCVVAQVYSLQPLHALAAARLFEQFSPRPIRLNELDMSVNNKAQVTPQQGTHCIRWNHKSIG